MASWSAAAATAGWPRGPQRPRQPDGESHRSAAGADDGQRTVEARAAERVRETTAAASSAGARTRAGGAPCRSTKTTINRRAETRPFRWRRARVQRRANGPSHHSGSGAGRRDDRWGDAGGADGSPSGSERRQCRQTRWWTRRTARRRGGGQGCGRGRRRQRGQRGAEPFPPEDRSWSTKYLRIYRVLTSVEIAARRERCCRPREFSLSVRVEDGPRRHW